MAGDCPNFAESAEQNGTVPFSEAILLHALKNSLLETLIHILENFSPGACTEPDVGRHADRVQQEMHRAIAVQVMCSARMHARRPVIADESTVVVVRLKIQRYDWCRIGLAVWKYGIRGRSPVYPNSHSFLSAFGDEHRLRQSVSDFGGLDLRDRIDHALGFYADPPNMVDVRSADRNIVADRVFAGRIMRVFSQQ